MTNVRRAVAKVALALVMTGSLAAAAPGVAGAAQATGGSQPGHHSGGAYHRLCVHEQRALAFDLRRQKQFIANTAAFVRLEASATKAGHTTSASYWAKVVSRRTAHGSKLQANYQARVTRVAKTRGLVNGKCS